MSMSYLAQSVMGSTSVAQYSRLWTAHVDALERHLSAKMWALTAAAVVLITYPIARILIPVAIHAVVPDVVRTVLSLIGA
jgi:hypothetical protein